MERYICVHAHFYQPPRENPWLEAIEPQDSAYPYHDWNEKITAECYATNMSSRILDGKGRILELVNNYSRISFNFGPTLLSWLEEKTPDIYKALQDADRESRERFSGHGSALAQAYNHMILPLANQRDKETQVHWGIRDFKVRFGREPEGMWLAETAVDLKSLEVLAEAGIRFTVLAPHQAARVRPFGGPWQEVTGQKIDPTRAYKIRLPSGRKMALFFYDGPISRAIAFEKLLNSGETLVNRLVGGFSDHRDWPQLLHIATDGETYGHHHRHGEMALSYALTHIESEGLARLTNYGEYLEKHPPDHEVEILENTSWSCAHGVDRWRKDCGCCTGFHPGWSQAWREPLRQALDWLRDELVKQCEERGRDLITDIWAARNDYVDLVMDRSIEAGNRFLEKHAARPLEGKDRQDAMRIMEMQRNAMLMYTSCGWFFDELSGLETVQILRYAGRAIQLAKAAFGFSLEGRFLRLLGRAKSNLPNLRDGRSIYDKEVKPARVNLMQVGAHYAMTSLFEDYGDVTPIYSFRAEREYRRTSKAGKARLLVGRAHFTSKITGKTALLSYGVIHQRDHILNCGVRTFRGEKAYQIFEQELFDAFSRGDFAATLRLLDKHFRGATYSLKTLFRNEQRKITDLVLESTVRDVEASYRRIYDYHAPLMRFLRDSDVPLPKALSTTKEFVVNMSLRRAFEMAKLNIEEIEPFLEEARSEEIHLDAATLEYAFRRCLERMARRLHGNPTDLSLLRELEGAVSLLDLLPFQVNLWTVQNLFYHILKDRYPELKKQARKAQKTAREWVDCFTALGERIYIRVG